MISSIESLRLDGDGEWIGDFIIAGCHQNIYSVINNAWKSERLIPPLFTMVDGMGYRTSGKLPPNFVNFPLLLWSDHYVDTVLYSKDHRGFKLLCPHQYREFYSQDYFFFQDTHKTFFIIPPHDRASRFELPAPNASSDIVRMHYPKSRYAVGVPQTTDSPPFNLVSATDGILSANSLQKNSAGIASAQILSANGGKSQQVAAVGSTNTSGQTGNSNKITSLARIIRRREYTFKPFYHPYVCSFLSAVQGDKGVDGLLKWPTPRITTANWPTLPIPTPLQLQMRDFFGNYYIPKEVAKPYPVDEVDFELDGAYAQYNWELFFHIPLYMAQRLSSNQKFADAQKWFHYIFDPTRLYPVAPPQATNNFPYGYWKVKPFYEQTDETTLAGLIALLDSRSPYNPLEQQKLIKLVREWKTNPFDPFLIGRARTSAFQKTVVMKYLDNLISWGDNLFSQNTRETINQATQLYILAEQILGPRPQEVSRGDASPLSYKDLSSKFASADDFSDPMVLLENAIPAPHGPGMPSQSLPYVPNPLATALYFCIPENDKLLTYWNTIADRLFKIRNCMNIDGQIEQLALFSPPIPPGMLVAAAASGNLAAAISGLNSPPPIYRFSFMIKIAMDFCKKVQKFGDKLLKALERDDVEALAMIKATDEVTLQQAIRQEMVMRVQEATAQLQEIQLFQKRIQDRQSWYAQYGANAANDLEITALALEAGGDIAKLIAMGLHTGAGVSFILPDVTLGVTGFGGSPTLTAKMGGGTFGKSASAFGKVADMTGELLKDSAKILMEIDKFQVRQEEWQREAMLSQDQLNEINQQLAVQQIKIDLTTQQLQDHDLKTQDAQNVMNFLTSKFTNQSLYDWMIDQISGVYFQGYQTALYIAAYTQKCFIRELPDYPAPNFIQANYWNSLEQGLLSGESLESNLMQMQSAYLNYNRREFEILKSISLKSLSIDPIPSLISSGNCSFSISQSLYDSDYSGHYLRKIKYVQLSFKISSTLATPPASINATLTLTGSSMQDQNGNPIDPHIMGSMVTSSGEKDNGVFETTLHYILTDDRYLFFEGAGAVSQWTLDMPLANNPHLVLNGSLALDDVTLTINYTARAN